MAVSGERAGQGQAGQGKLLSSGRGDRRALRALPLGPALALGLLWKVWPPLGWRRVREGRAWPGHSESSPAQPAPSLCAEQPGSLGLWGGGGV